MEKKKKGSRALADFEDKMNEVGLQSVTFMIGLSHSSFIMTID